jgi:hypothetical protein
MCNAILLEIADIKECYINVAFGKLNPMNETNRLGVHVQLGRVLHEDKIQHAIITTFELKPSRSKLIAKCRV